MLNTTTHPTDLGIPIRRRRRRRHQMGVAVSPVVILRRQFEIFAPKTWEPRQQAAAAELYPQG